MRRSRRIAAIAAAAAVGLVLLAGGTAILAINSESGRNWIASWLAAAVSTPGAMEVSIEGLGDGLPGRVAIDRIGVADGDGTWLEVRGLALDWSPWSLLAGRVAVDTLAVDEISLLRRPSSSSEDTPSAPGGPLLPEPPGLAVQVGSLAVSRIVLGEAVAGLAAEGRATGSVDLDAAGAGRLALDLLRIDGGEGRLAVRFDVDLASDRVALSAELDEAADGIVTRLLGIAPYPPLAATLAADGTTSDLSGSLSVVLAETADTDIAFAVSEEDGGRHVTLDGRAHPGGLLDAQSAALVGDEIRWEADALIFDDRMVLRSSKLVAEPATLSLDGTVGLGDGTLDLSLEAAGVATPALAAVAAPWSFAGWTLSARIDGTLGAPSARAELAIERPSGEGLAAAAALLDLHVSLQQREALAFDAMLTIDRPDPGDALAAAQLGEALTLAARGSVMLDGTRAAVEAAQLRLADGALTLAADIDLGQGTVMVHDLEGDLPIAPLGSLVGMALGGRAQVAGDFALGMQDSSARGSLTVRGSELTTGDPMLDAALGTAPSIALSLAGSPQGVTVDAATLDLPVWSAMGSMAWDAAGTVRARLSGPFRMTPAMAAQTHGGVAGNGTLTVELAGTLAAPRAAIRLAVERGRFDAVPLDGAVLTATDLVFASGLGGTIGLDLPWQGEIVRARTVLAGDAGFERLTLSGLRLTGHGMDVGGELTVDLARTALEGRIAGRIASLALLGPMLGLDDLSGQGAFEVALTPGPEGQGASGRLGIGAMTVEGVYVDSLLFAVEAEDVLAAPRLSYRGSLDGVELPVTSAADRILIRGEGTLDALGFAIEAASFAKPGWRFDSEGQVGMDDGRTTLDIARLDLVSANHRISATSPLRLVTDASGFDSGDLALDIDGGSVTLRIARGPDGLSGSATVEALPIDAASLATSTMDMHGRLDGTASLKLGAAEGSADVSLVASDVHAADAELAQHATIRLDATWDGRTLKLDSAMTGIDGISLDLSALWPLVLDPATGALSVPANAPVSAELRANGDVARLWEQLPVGDQLLSGQLALDLDVTGAAADPALEGSATLTGGRFEELELGTVIDDIRLDAVASEDGTLRVTMEATDGGSGRLSLDGTADIDGAGRPVIDAKLTLQEARLVRRDDARLTVNGEASFKGQLFDGKIAGRFETALVEINVDQSLPPSVTVLDVVDVFAYHGAGDAPVRTAPWRASLDIRIDMPRRVFVRGRGLDSEWSGRILVTGDSTAPQVDAELTMVRGTLDLIGRRLTLQSGSVSLRPSDAGDPRIDVVASTRSGGVTGQIGVSGRLSKPQLKVTTVPPLPEDEALARLLFGRGTGGLSGFEAIQLADAIAGITGTGTGSGMIERARTALGVDVLEVGTDDDGQATVGAGRYLSEGVYVGVEQGVAADSSGVVVEIELTDNLTLETEAGADASARVGIDWRWDY